MDGLPGPPGLPGRDGERVSDFLDFIDSHQSKKKYDLNQGEPGDSGSYQGIVPGPRGDPGIPGRSGVGVSRNSRKKEPCFNELIFRAGPVLPALPVNRAQSNILDLM